jgi:radical SAM superfamily enzyme YgiQ (UPF0313 family)
MNNNTFSNRKVVVMETLPASSRVTGTFTRGQVLEPYPAEILAGAVEAAGFEGVAFQPGTMSDEEIVSWVVAEKPFCVGMTVFGCSYPHAQTLAYMIKAEMPEVLIVIGGYHPSTVPGCIDFPDFDFAVIGEGEVTFVELLNAVASNQPFSEIKGISYVENDEVVVTAPRERIYDLDTLAWAKRVPEYLAQARSYNLSYPSPDQQVAVAEVFASRGCPGRCSWCVSNIMWDARHGIDEPCKMSVSHRSAKSVAAEVRFLHDTYGVNLLYFTDLTFNLSKERVREICDALVAEGLHDAATENNPNHAQDSVHWYCLCKVGLDDETAQLMADAGCAKIGMGVESFFEAKAEEWCKPHHDLGITYKSLKAASDAGIITRCLLVFGSPDETKETIQETIDGLKSYPVDQVRIAFLTPFPGTEFAKEMADFILTDDLSLYDTETPILQGNLTQEELIAARTRIGRDFYSSDEYAARCISKLERFPHLRESYRWWFEDLNRRGIADLRHLAD